MAGQSFYWPWEDPSLPAFYRSSLYAKYGADMDWRQKYEQEHPRQAAPNPVIPPAPSVTALMLGESLTPKVGVEQLKHPLLLTAPTVPASSPNTAPVTALPGGPRLVPLIGTQ